MTYIDVFRRGRQRYSLPKLWAYLETVESAMNGDIILVATPATTGSSAAAIAAAIAGAAGKFTRDVALKLTNTAGDIQTWYNGTMSIGVVDVTAGDGVSAIEDSATTVTFASGQATVTIEYTGTWDDGIAQVETMQVTHKADSAGTITMRLTAAGMAGSPIDTALEVALNDTAAQVATKVADALTAVAAIAAKFTVTVTGAGLDTITVTAKTKAANDGTLALAFTDTDTTGVTVGASTNATAGVAPDTNTLTVIGGTVLGASVTNKTSVDTVIA